MSYTLGDILEAYEYNYGHNLTQNIASLLYLADCFEPTFLSCISEEIGVNNKKNNLFELFPFISHEISIEKKATYIANELFFEDFSEGHNFLVKATQQLFFGPRCEIWESKIPQWIDSNLSIVVNILQNLGLASSIIPTKKEYDCVAVFGSTAYEMQKRLNFSYDLINKEIISLNDSIFLLSGERYANPKIDNISLIINTAEYFGLKNQQVTEAHIMEKLHLNYIKIQDLNVNYKLVDTARGSKSRPNTADTIEEFIKQYPNKCGSVLFISRSPHIYEQAEAAYAVIKKTNLKLEYEVVGDKYNYDEIPILHAAYQMIRSMAGAWFRGWKRVEFGFYNNSVEMPSELTYTTNCVRNFKNQTLVTPY